MAKGSEKGFHLAGIIPVSGMPLGFDTMLHPSMVMIGEKYLALERSIAECAFAGCESIWICVDDDVQPIIKKHVGEYGYIEILQKRIIGSTLKTNRK